jgi:hypothetical protein
VDQFKGVGIDIRDPFENFRKSKGQAFITRMRSRAEEREKEKTGGVGVTVNLFLSFTINLHLNFFHLIFVDYIDQLVCPNTNSFSTNSSALTLYS